jgi:hypothetical protein
LRCGIEDRHASLRLFLGTRHSEGRSLEMQ